MSVPHEGILGLAEGLPIHFNLRVSIDAVKDKFSSSASLIGLNSEFLCVFDCAGGYPFDSGVIVTMEGVGDFFMPQQVQMQS